MTPISCASTEISGGLMPWAARSRRAMRSEFSTSILMNVGAPCHCTRLDKVTPRTRVDVTGTLCRSRTRRVSELCGLSPPAMNNSTSPFDLGHSDVLDHQALLFDIGTEAFS